jgi:hypothetical protein
MLCRFSYYAKTVLEPFYAAGLLSAVQLLFFAVLLLFDAV